MCSYRRFGGYVCSNKELAGACVCSNNGAEGFVCSNNEWGVGICVPLPVRVERGVWVPIRGWEGRYILMPL